jgi:hypothetical protein
LPGLVPGRVVEAHQLAERRRAVIVDEDVEPAEMRQRLRNDALAIRGPADIGRDGENAPAGLLADALGGGLERLGAARHQRDIGTVAGKTAGDGIADARARPADDSNLAMQRRHAACSSPKSRAALPCIT